MAIANATLTTSAAQIFLSSNAEGDSVVLVSLTNYSGVAQTVDLHACPAAEAASDQNKVLHQLSIPAGESYMYESKLLLSQNDDIKATASANSSIAVTVSYA